MIKESKIEVGAEETVGTVVAALNIAAARAAEVQSIVVATTIGLVEVDAINAILPVVEAPSIAEGGTTMMATTIIATTSVTNALDLVLAVLILTAAGMMMITAETIIPCKKMTSLASALTLFLLAFLARLHLRFPDSCLCRCRHLWAC